MIDNAIKDAMLLNSIISVNALSITVTLGVCNSILMKAWRHREVKFSERNTAGLKLCAREELNHSLFEPEGHCAGSFNPSCIMNAKGGFCLYSTASLKAAGSAGNLINLMDGTMRIQMDWGWHEKSTLVIRGTWNRFSSSAQIT